MPGNQELEIVNMYREEPTPETPHLPERYAGWQELAEEPLLLEETWQIFSKQYGEWLGAASVKEGSSQEEFIDEMWEAVVLEGRVTEGKRLLQAYVGMAYDIQWIDEDTKDALVDEVDAMAREGQARLLVSEMVAQTSMEADSSEKFEAVTDFLFSEAAQGKLESYEKFSDWAKLSLIASDEGSLRLLYSKLTGETAPVSSWLQERLVTAEGVEIRFIEGQGVVAVSSSVNRLYGEESAAAAVFKHEHGVSDTPVVWYVPVSAVEMVQLKRYAREDQRAVLARLIAGASEIVSLGHGFGANKDVWESGAGELIGDNQGGVKLEEPGRRIAVAASVRGAEGTALIVEENGKKRPLCGDMNQAAGQWTETLVALGMVGENKQLFHIGHSMGGWEAVALAGLIERRHRVGVYVLNPVLNNSPEHLRFLFGGWDGRLTRKYLEIVCEDKFGAARLRWLSEMTDYQLQRLMIARVAGANGQVHGVHQGEVRLERTMRAHLRGIREVGEIWPYYDMVSGLYPGRVVGWGVSLEDNTLGYGGKDFEQMEARLDGQYAEFPGVGHYAQLVDGVVKDIGDTQKRFFEGEQ